jgi:hypothetical protein
MMRLRWSAWLVEKASVPVLVLVPMPNRWRMPGG